MSKLEVNPEIRKAIAQEVKAHRNNARAKTKYDAEKVKCKKRGDELKSNIELDKLLNHADRLYFESIDIDTL